MTSEYDVIVIGAGSTGENVAWYARDNGLSVAIVESGLVGGECSYWACIPSKVLLRTPEVLAAARRVPGAAAAVTGELDVDAALARRDQFVKGWDDDDQAGWLQSIGVDLVRGRGRLAGERTVEVESADGGRRALTARTAVVVATGSRAAVPPVEGLRDIRVWDNRDATSAKHVPARLLVLGGGAVGCEMAQAWRGLGAEEVTIVEMQDRIIPPYEPFASGLLHQSLEEAGVRVLTGKKAVRARRQADDAPVTLTLDDDTELVGDELLVAVGRVFNSDDLGVETVGLEPGGPLEVDDRLRVKAVDGDWLYAAGDVNGRALLTHQGKYQARLIGDLVAGKRREALADRVAVPQVIFTDPQVAAVGPTEQQARDAGRSVKAVEYDLAGVSGAALLGQAVRGRAKLVLDQDRRVIVGATFVGPLAGELLHAATIAIVGEVPVDRLWHAVPAFPTVSEVWLRLLEADRGL
ncbi:MAG: NAD(P)/FAD-dependent oxidoreductase [Actinomycetota bacterium]|nr:NAD(P)/FAD-dependent oxidoreductase [Actinomycetota bacterium]